jgi:hypothetical protein
MQFSPRRLPKIVLRRVEEEFPIWRKIVVSAMCRCADQIIILSYFEDLYGPNNKMFSVQFNFIYIPCIIYRQTYHRFGNSPINKTCSKNRYINSMSK